jgi:HEPN domain-containing protein
MNRAGFKRMALIRLTEAETLLKNRNYDGAYYLCGYVIECALKACIAKNTKRHDFPDLEVVKSSWTHKLHQLVGVAGLQSALSAQMNQNSSFASNWATVKDWNEESRYERNSYKKTRDLYFAISDKTSGVLTWVMQYW